METHTVTQDTWMKDILGLVFMQVYFHSRTINVELKYLPTGVEFGSSQAGVLTPSNLELKYKLYTSRNTEEVFCRSHKHTPIL